MSYAIYTVNKNFFKSIKSPEQAYVLGFIYSDGYNDERFIKITQTEPHTDIIPKIRDVMQSTHSIVDTLNPNKTKHTLSLQINGKNMCEDLKNLGAPRCKSLILKFPTFDIVPEKYMSHFIRGYFDGDGCVWEGKRQKKIVKDSKSKSGFRERIIHNVKFTITGSKDFIEGLQQYLVNILGFKKTKLNFSKSKELHLHCTMEYSGRGQLKKFYDYIYKDDTISINYKKQKFENIFRALDEKSSSELGLTAGTPEMVISNQAANSNYAEGSSTIPEMEVESSDSKCPTLNK